MTFGDVTFETFLKEKLDCLQKRWCNRKRKDNLSGDLELLMASWYYFYVNRWKSPWKVEAKGKQIVQWVNLWMAFLGCVCQFDRKCLFKLCNSDEINFKVSFKSEDMLCSKRISNSYIFFWQNFFMFHEWSHRNRNDLIFIFLSLKAACRKWCK